jgi:acyl-CoA synthetase (AMP-forming)/AMP-acid ligase II
MSALPSTLPHLLQARAVVQNTAQIIFLSADGSVSKALSYAELFNIASVYARRLLAAGLTESDVVLASFADHESHIYLFWACCLAGIPFCPLPALHPDPSQQVKLFNHLQSLFSKPTLVGSEQIVQGVRTLVPDLKALVLEELPAFEANNSIPSSRLASHLRAIPCVSFLHPDPRVTPKQYCFATRISCLASVVRFITMIPLPIRASSTGLPLTMSLR